MRCMALCSPSARVVFVHQVQVGFLTAALRDYLARPTSVLASRAPPQILPIPKTSV